MWSKICHVETFLHMMNVETIFLSLFMLICREICFVAIYAVLAQNLFCRDLRTFVWRKNYSEIVLVEKKGQISGMLWRTKKAFQLNTAYFTVFA